MIVKMKQVYYREVEIDVNDVTVVGLLQRDMPTLMKVHNALLELVVPIPLMLESTGVALMLDEGNPGEWTEGPMLIEYEGDHVPEDL